MNSCDYYIEDTFNDRSETLPINRWSLSILHLNIRSIPRNLSYLQTYLNNLDIQFSVIGISETWLEPYNVDCYGMDGYKEEHLYRSERMGGGVSLHVMNGIEYFVRNDMSIIDEHLESLFIEVDKSCLSNENNSLIGVIYRPPNTDIDIFINHLMTILDKIKLENKSCHLMGDFNINLLNAESHSKTGNFLDILASYSLMPNITKPTRATEETSTLIDNIFCDNIKENLNTISGILYTDISDHFPIFYIDYSSSVDNTEQFATRRLYNENNKKKFCKQISEYNWDNVLLCTDSQESFSTFHKEFSYIYNSCFPSKILKLNYRNRKIWLTNGMKESIKIKNKLYRKCKKYPSPENEQRYKSYRNKLNSLLKLAEKKHYEMLIEENKNNLRNTWRVIKEVVNKHKTPSPNLRFLVHNKITCDKATIANGFNSYFLNIGPNLANNVAPSPKSHSSYLKEQQINSIFIQAVIEEEVHTVIQQLKLGSAGWDSISPDIIKLCDRYISTPLTHVINLSLSQGHFPRELKIARIIPLLKSGDPMIFSNYRPVSVLPAFWIIYERIMYNRLIKFLNDFDILYDFQFGFRTEHSPNIALIYLVDKIIDSLNNGKFVIGLFLAFKKAFDTVNHEIMLSKLYHYGIRGVAHKWFGSYLNNREQYVEYAGTKSELNNITCGIPQGSILGPLLFLLYINDLANVSNVLFSILFADDSNLFISGDDPNDLVSTMNKAMIKVIDWLRANKLTLNTDKTHFVLFRRQRKLANLTQSLIISGQHIAQVKSTKFLGIIIDDSLKWGEHAKYVKGKISRGMIP